jgi:polyhydroxyalkanoate synthesis regulator phasin
MDETIKQEIENLLNDLIKEIDDNIKRLESQISDNEYNINQLDTDIENVMSQLERLPTDTIVAAITELQKAVADLMSQPVGMVFSRIKRD